MEKLTPEQLLNKYILYCDINAYYEVFMKVEKAEYRIGGICLQGPKFTLNYNVLSFDEFGSATFSEWECNKMHIMDEPGEYAKDFCNRILKKF